MMRVALAQLLHRACQPWHATQRDLLRAACVRRHIRLYAGRIQVAMQVIECQQVDVDELCIGSVWRVMVTTAATGQQPCRDYAQAGACHRERRGKHGAL